MVVPVVSVASVVEDPELEPVGSVIPVGSAVPSVMVVMVMVMVAGFVELVVGWLVLAVSFDVTEASSLFGVARQAVRRMQETTM